MLLYGINLYQLTEELQEEDPDLLALFYLANVAFDGFTKNSVQLLKILREWGSYWG